MTRDEEWLLREKYVGEKSEAFFADRQRLTTGEPLAYIIGHQPFLNCTIWLDSRPLIPRPETEFWTEQAISRIKKQDNKSPKILDLCAGSGCIGVAVAVQIPTALIDFAEIDIAHFPTIKKNLLQNEISSRHTNIIESDLFTNISCRYDFILSNPPYIDKEKNRTEPSVTEFEPHNALYGGHLGLVFIEKIINETRTHLAPNGQLWLEHEPEQTPTIHALAKSSGLSVSTHQDQFGVERYSILVLQ
jgi:HemK-like putative methylase